MPFLLQQWLVISCCHLLYVMFDLCDIGKVNVCVCVYPRTQACDLLNWCQGNVFLIASKKCYTADWQVTNNWPAALWLWVHEEREMYMDGWANVRIWREGVFHPLISEAAGVLLLGLGGQGRDINGWFTSAFLWSRSRLQAFSRFRFTDLENVSTVWSPDYTVGKYCIMVH